MGVRTNFYFYFFWVLKWPTPPFFRVLVIMVHLFLPNLSSFGIYAGYEISGGLDRWRHLGLIFIEFERFEMTTPPIFKCSNVNGGVIFAWKCRVCKILKVWGFWIAWAFWPDCDFYFKIWRWPIPPFSSVVIMMVWKHFLNLSPFGSYGGFDFFNPWLIFPILS